MKVKKMMGLGFAVAAICLLGTINLAWANAFHVTNKTGAAIKVTMHVRSSWASYSKPMDNMPQSINNNETKAIMIRADSENLCAAFIEGTDAADYSKKIVPMGCDGIENNKSSRCCGDVLYDAYKQTDGTLHFLKK